MSMILASVSKSTVSFRQFVTHRKFIKIQAMSTDRKRTGQGNNLNDNGGN